MTAARSRGIKGRDAVVGRAATASLMLSYAGVQDKCAWQHRPRAATWPGAPGREQTRKGTAASAASGRWAFPDRSYRITPKKGGFDPL